MTIPNKIVLDELIIKAFVKHTPFLNSWPENKCYRWSGWLDENGYGRLYFEIDNLIYRYTSHRISYMIYNRLNELEGDFNHLILHQCRLFVEDKKDHCWCINPKHLYLGTPVENNRDILNTRNNSSTSKKNGYAILTESKILQIREDHKQGMLQYKIAEKHNISESYVSQIVNRKCWKHI